MSNEARIQREIELAASQIPGISEAYRRWLVGTATDVWRNEIQHSSVRINVNQRIALHLDRIPGLETSEPEAKA